MVDPYQTPQAELHASLPLDDLELATRGKRLGGSLLDSLIVTPLNFGIWYVTGFFDVLFSGNVSALQLFQVSAIGFVVFFGLNGYLLANRGQTIGKYLVKTQIVDFENGEIPAIGRMIGLRYVPFWIASAIPLVGNVTGLVNGLFIFGESKRCLHDYLARTKVVQLPS